MDHTAPPFALPLQLTQPEPAPPAAVTLVLMCVPGFAHAATRLPPAC